MSQKVRYYLGGTPVPVFKIDLANGEVATLIGGIDIGYSSVEEVFNPEV